MSLLTTLQENQSLNSGIKQLQEGLERLVIDSDNVGHSMERLEMILSQLVHPINRQATQISELHDSLNREFTVVDVDSN